MSDPKTAVVILLSDSAEIIPPSQLRIKSVESHIRHTHGHDCAVFWTNSCSAMSTIQMLLSLLTSSDHRTTVSHERLFYGDDGTFSDSADIYQLLVVRSDDNSLNCLDIIESCLSV